MTMVCPIFDRVDLLPYFLRYYTKLGITRFVFVLWNGCMNKQWLPTVAACKGYNVLITMGTCCTPSEYNGIKERDGLHRVIQDLGIHQDWYMIADLDEFHFFKESLETFKALPENFIAVGGTFVDRVSHDAFMPAVDYSKTLDTQFAYASDITKTVKANTNKIAMMRGVLPGVGHHYIDSPGSVCNANVEVHHFKWTAGIVERLQDRAERYTKQGLTWAGESAEILNILLKRDYQTVRLNYRKARRIGI
jgi:hypothetical protein